MITVAAPAKLNLTLEVIGRRDDGFHEINSVVQAIGLCDRLHFEAADVLKFCATKGEWSAAKSLVGRAARRLMEATGINRGARVNIEKNIPLRAGLGGDSSDAAAILIGLNRLWGLNLSRGALTEIAASLGSDVPFFISGGTALIRDRGEIVSTLPAPSFNGRVVLLVPSLVPPPDKTARLYSLLKPQHYTDGAATGQLAARLGSGQKIDDSRLFNVFDAVATDYFGLDEWRQRFTAAGADGVHVAGSGPVLFTLIPDVKKAEAICRNLREQGFEACLTSFLALDYTDDVTL